MSMCPNHSRNDPRFEAGKALFMAGDVFAHAIMATVDPYAEESNKVMKAIQLMLMDLVPPCMYEEILIEAVSELYPQEVRRTVADTTMSIVKNSPHEPSAQQREHLNEFLRRFTKGE